MKRIVSAALCALTLAALVCPAALAENTPLLISTNQEATLPDMQQIEAQFIQISGTITEVDAASGQVTVEKADGTGLIVLNTDKNTYIVDNATKKPVSVKSLKAGSMVYAWHSRATTMSLPPQSYAYAITANVAKDTTPGQFYEIERVTKNSDGSYTLLNQQQDLLFTLPKGTTIPLFGSSKALSPSSLKPGMQLMLWYDIVLESFPGQASSSELIAFPYSYTGYISVDGADVMVNGALMKKAVYRDQAGNALIPLRSVAGKLGFSTRWDAGEKVLTLKKGDQSAVISAGKNVFLANGNEVGTIAPVMHNGALYAPATIFAHIGDYKLAQPIR